MYYEGKASKQNGTYGLGAKAKIEIISDWEGRGRKCHVFQVFVGYYVFMMCLDNSKTKK